MNLVDFDMSFFIPKRVIDVCETLLGLFANETASTSF